jgi:hypothetical protein
MRTNREEQTAPAQDDIRRNIALTFSDATIDPLNPARNFRADNEN